MKLVSVKCPSCGASVEVDAYDKSFYCKYCGVSTVIEKDHLNTNYWDKYVEKAEMYIDKFQDYKKAKSEYESVVRNDPGDPRGLQGLLRCATRDLTEKLYIEVEDDSPIWLPGMEARVKKLFDDYKAQEKKPDALAFAQSVFDNYIQTNKDEYEELLTRFPEEKVEEYEKYDTTIKAENKIISAEKLKEIIDLMQKIIIKYKKIDAAQAKKNEVFDYDEKESPFADNGSKLTFRINFHDNTESDINDYDQFMKIYEERLSEIKYLWVKFTFNYSIVTPEPHRDTKYVYESIDLSIYEDKIKIETDIKQEDHKLDYLYNKIREIILTAPEKYDDIIKKRTFIMTKVGLSYGLVPSTILCLLSCASETIRLVYMTSFVLFPIATILLGFAIGVTISFFIMNKLYQTLIPEKKYVGYDKKYGSVYADNVDDYINSSEILIGNNVMNQSKRDKIKEMLEKSNKLLLIEFAVVLVISVIIIGLGLSE